MLFELIFGVVDYGLWCCNSVEQESGDWDWVDQSRCILFRMSGITAVIFAAGLILGGIVVGFPSGYQFVYRTSL